MFKRLETHILHVTSGSDPGPGASNSSVVEQDVRMAHLGYNLGVEPSNIVRLAEICLEDFNVNVSIDILQFIC